MNIGYVREWVGNNCGVMKMNRFVRYAGVMFSFFITANFYVVISVSMISENDAVIVYFNHFGEALIEYAIYIALIPVLLYSFYCEVKKFRRSKKYGEKRKPEAHIEGSN